MPDQKKLKTTSFTLPNDVDQALIFGPGNGHIGHISSHLGIDITVMDSHLSFTGGTDNRRRLARDVIKGMIAAARKGEEMTIQTLNGVLNEKFPKNKPVSGANDNMSRTFNENALTMKSKVTVAPRNESQARYLKDIFNHEVTFGIGPAGTGKTYLAIAAAVHAFETDPGIKKLILCRPAVEAGEKIGFLPGGMKEKVDPYMQPLYDALYEMKGKAQVDNMIKNGEIEIAPLGFMRGRTLKNAFMILDEAQNTTPEQAKMFLTRMGEDSRVVVCGDLSQIDLPKGQESGLKHVTDRLAGVQGISIHKFGDADVVRHPMVARMVKAFK